MKCLCHNLLPILVALIFGSTHAQDLKHTALKSPYGAYADNGLPFFGQTLDARKLGVDWPKDNLTPRGIILNLRHGIHVCFDPDLLRVALIWQEEAPGNYLTMNGMAPGSYRQPHRKSPSGQKKLPTPIGTPLFATPLGPGIQSGKSANFKDPRSRSIDVEELGLGPLPAEQGRWGGLRLDRDGLTLLYEVGGTKIEERLSISHKDGNLTVVRLIQVAPHSKPISIRTGKESSTLAASDALQILEISYHCTEKTISTKRVKSGKFDSTPAAKIWQDTLPIKFAEDVPLIQSHGLVAENIPLPLPNPWKRNVRPSDFDFFPDGRLAMVTFDGDVWIADGVGHGRKQIRWQRYASGLHEPMGLRIEDGYIIIFDRNGLTKLIDRDNNGEADLYQCLSNLAAQTAETREFAMSLELKPGGGYYLAKGGQVGTTRGKYNGTILEISPDGKKLEVIATGLRQPFLGVDPDTGLLTASDQQGHWVPATPLHVIQPGKYYGFQPTFLGPKANTGKKIEEPPLWLPHFVNQSGARQVWLRKSQMGPINDSLIHIGYNRPALFKIYLGNDQDQGAVVPLMEGLPTGLLGGRVNPVDQLLYVGGFNLWGTVGKEIQGLYRVRPTEQRSWVPREIRAFKEGILLRFDHQLDTSLAKNFTNYTVDCWNYKRTIKYGSGHFNLDGKPGQELLGLSSIYLSKDRQSVFLGIPDMKPVHSLRVTYRVAPDQVSSAYLTAHRLKPAELQALGFKERTVNLKPRATTAGRKFPKPMAERGRKIATTYGCVACHSVDGSKKVAEEPSLVVGPSWRGLFGSKREFTDGTTINKADAVYLRESIIDPSRRITKGFETRKTGVGMASYLGVLREDQIESLILYIQSLK